MGIGWKTICHSEKTNWQLPVWVKGSLGPLGPAQQLLRSGVGGGGEIARGERRAMGGILQLL